MKVLQKPRHFIGGIPIMVVKTTVQFMFVYNLKTPNIFDIFDIL